MDRNNEKCDGVKSRINHKAIVINVFLYASYAHRKNLLSIK